MKTIDMENTPHHMPEDKSGGHVRRGRHARGGKTGTPIHEYNAVGSPEAEEAADEKDEFKKGGRKKRAPGGIALKDGGHAEGHEPHHRPDRAHRGHRASGGHVGHAHHDADGEHETHHSAHEQRGGHHAPGHAGHHIEHHVHLDGHEDHDGGSHHHKRAHGGRAEHEEHREHHRRAQGGPAMAGGHTPFSSGHKGAPRENTESPAARGYEGLKADDPPD